MSLVGHSLDIVWEVIEIDRLSMYVAVGIQSILIMPQPQENFENYTLEN